VEEIQMNESPQERYVRKNKLKPEFNHMHKPLDGIIKEYIKNESKHGFSISGIEFSYLDDLRNIVKEYAKFGNIVERYVGNKSKDGCWCLGQEFSHLDGLRKIKEDAQDLASKYGCDIQTRTLEFALIAGLAEKYYELVKLVERRGMLFEEDAREFAERYGFSTKPLEDLKSARQNAERAFRTIFGTE
jgi:hypothetical protein